MQISHFKTVVNSIAHTKTIFKHYFKNALTSSEGLSNFAIPKQHKEKTYSILMHTH